MRLISVFVFFLFAFFANTLLRQPSVRRRTNRIKTRGVRWWALFNRDISSLRARVPDEENPPWMVSGDGSDTPTMRYFTKRQSKMVLQNPGIIFAIAKAASLAVTECQYQFRGQRWNCPTTSSASPSIFGKILRKGIRETSFLYAITSAALSHTIARSCAEGSIHTCRCNMRQGRRRTPFHLQEQNSMINDVMRPRVTEWQGCGDDIKFASKLARRFTDVADRGRDLRNIVNRHNNEVGRRVAFFEINEQCKCHGMSGSCTLKTCWRKLRPFREVSDKIKARFSGAKKVIQKNGAHHSRQSRSFRGRFNPNLLLTERNSPLSPHNKQLVFFENSPDFCLADRSLSLSGTRGRQCNETHSYHTDGCGTLCCSRGHQTKVTFEKQRCKCRFIWCCQVQCETCLKRVKRHFCL